MNVGYQKNTLDDNNRDKSRIKPKHKYFMSENIGQRR